MEEKPRICQPFQPMKIAAQWELELCVNFWSKSRFLVIFYLLLRAPLSCDDDEVGLAPRALQDIMQRRYILFLRAC